MNHYRFPDGNLLPPAIEYVQGCHFPFSHTIPGLSAH